MIVDRGNGVHAIWWCRHGCVSIDDPHCDQGYTCGWLEYMTEYRQGRGLNN